MPELLGRSQLKLPSTVSAVVLATVILLLGACSGDPATRPILVIGGIPDQNMSVLEERFNTVAEHLSEELGTEVKYVPVTDYVSLVTAFKNGDVMLGWFGGFTGVQARSLTPGAEAIVQRPRDENFTSAFIVNSSSEATALEDLKGHSFTFGSTNSTSGHLMPRSFLIEAGIDPESDFDGIPNYSGSHDLTWKLVEMGSFQAGVLNSAVWERAVSNGQVNTAKVRLLAESPPYADYHWLAHPDIDEFLGAGTTERITDALLGLSPMDESEARILELFETGSFMSTDNSKYQVVEEVARSLNMLQ